MFRLSPKRLGVILFLFSWVASNSSAQVVQTGVVSYVSAQNVYVRFENTEKLAVGDSLWSSNRPVLVINRKSSISVISSCIDSLFNIEQGDTVYHIQNASNIVETPEEDSIKRDGLKQTILFSNTFSNREISKTTKEIEPSWDWNGNLGWSSRLNRTFVSTANRTNLRQFGRFNVRGQSPDEQNPLRVNISGNYQHYSTDFSERSDYPKAGRLNLYQAQLGYQVNDRIDVTAGRGFQPNLIGVGILDALNMNFQSDASHFGLVAGFSPDISSFQPNTQRPIFGARVGTNINKKKASFQFDLAWFDQYYEGKLDRRIINSQGSLNTDRVNFFYLLETDLSNQTLPLKLQSVYSSIRVRLSKRWSVFSSYDTRLPLIYWSSYSQKRIDNLALQERQNGWRTRLRFQANKSLSIGMNMTIRSWQTASQMYLGGIDVYQNKWFWKGGSFNYRMNIADYGIWQNVQQLVRFRQRIKQTSFSLFYRSVLFARRYTMNSLFNQNYMGVQSSFPLPNNYILSAFAEYDIQQQQQQLIFYLTLNKRF